MRKHFLWSILSMTLAVMLSVQITSCGPDPAPEPTPDPTPTPAPTPITPTSAIYTKPINFLIMSYGVAFNYDYGTSTKYYYDKLFSIDEYRLLSRNEVISRVATGVVSDRNLPDPSNYACWTGLRPNTEYVYVSVSFGENGEQGDVVIQNIYTKPNDSQPEAVITDLNLENPTSSTYYYKWYVTRNTLCSQYYTYVAVCPNMFYAYYALQDGASPLIAWALKQEIEKNPRTHSTSINQQTDVRDQFYSVKYNDGTERFSCNLLQDRYFLLVTWGSDPSGNLSGILNYGYIDLLSSSTTPNSKLQFAVPSPNNTTKEPQRVSFNINDWEFIPIN